MDKIKIGIVGYGNLGKSVEKNIKKEKDLELVAILTRRNIKEVKSRSHIEALKNILEWKDKIDVMILCGGSSSDLPNQAPEILQNFNTVDSFDTHARIPQYLDTLDKIAKQYKKTAIISAGWDPGIFSMQRLLAEAILPNGETNTFWGPGVSQGHSEAIRKIDGVIDGIQYTIPKEDALKMARERIKLLTTKGKHLRKCYVVAKDGENKTKIEDIIKNMPYYFSDYETEVEFIDKKEMRKHRKMPHGGYVIRKGRTGENKHLIEYKLKLESNPDFTASIMLAFARANYKLQQEKQYGAKTVFDIPPYMLSNKDRESLIKELM